MTRTSPGDANSGSQAATVDVRPMLCPYCGGAAVGGRCGSCGGLLEPLSMQATQNEMGPWFIRDAAHPFRPGCSYGTLRKLAERGRITPETILRGPTTRQFWSFARNVRGVAHLLGVCHNCHGPAGADEYMCRSCGAVFEAPKDRQYFGAGAVRLIPGHAPPEIVARSVVNPENAPQQTHPAPKPSAPTAPASVRTDRASDMVPASTLRALKRQLNDSRRLITISVAMNVVLLFALLMAILVPQMTTSASPDAENEPVATSPEAASIDAQSQVILAAARELAASDDPDNWRAAEKIVRAVVTGRPDDERPAEAAELLHEIQRKLSEQSMQEFLPQE